MDQAKESTYAGFGQNLPYDTYDRLVQHPSVRLARLVTKYIPTRVSQTLIGRVLPDVEKIQSHRTKVCDAHGETIETYRTFCTGLAVPYQPENDVRDNSTPLGSTDIRSVINHWIDSARTAREFQLDSEQRTARGEEYETVLRTRRTQGYAIQNRIKELLTNDCAYLTAAEQHELRTAETVTTAIIRAVETRLERLHDARETTRGLKEGVRSANKLAAAAEAAVYIRDASLQHNQLVTVAEMRWRVGEWEYRLDLLESRLEPYQKRQRYDIDQELITDLESLGKTVETVVQRCDDYWLPDKLLNRINIIEERLAQLAGVFENYHAAYIHEVVEKTEARVEQGLDSIDDALTPSRREGRRLDQPEQMRTHLTTLREAIAVLQDGQIATHLHADQQERLDGLKSKINDRTRYVEAKSVFDTHIRRVKQDLENLRQTAEPYRNYERYLTRPAEKTLDSAIHQTTASIETLREAVNIEILTDPDQQQLSDIVAEQTAIQDCVDGYNERFVNRECEQYQDVFSNIGAASLSLTLGQQQAVVRNGLYNQVIAAAGTGKTLALTTRVAYLIESQDIQPERILVVTFTGEAAEEMETRLEHHFGITDVQVQTLHAFGNSVINDATPGHPDIIDPKQVRNLIDRVIRDARADHHSDFLDHYYEFLLHFDNTYLEEADFETKKAYFEARRKQRYTTLKGEEVRSRAEKQIADFLFTHRVPYRYEDTATWAETADDRGLYNPDFYLPEHDIYIEHWGLNASGEVPCWFEISSKRYVEKLYWARSVFEEADFKLVETYEFEHQVDHLQAALRARLKRHGVELDRRSFENLVTEVFDYERREGWIKNQFKSFIENAKQFEILPDEIESKLDTANPRQYHFGHCGIYLLQQYQRYLVEHNFIDFTDMINRSLDLIEQNPTQFRSRYDHILVDEFQDLGKGQLDLIKSLTDESGPRLFAVGDDWQSIYSFRGAVVEYFINFESHFGSPVQTVLDRNFRSPPAIIAAGNELIAHNDDQIDKTVTPTITFDSVPLIHTLRGRTYWGYVHKVATYTVDLVLSYLEDGASPGDIMILCRFDGAVPYLDEIKSELRERKVPYEGKSDHYSGSVAYSGAASVYSVYQSKGREARHVIIVHAVEGPFGFPPSGRKDELLNPVKPFDVDTLAEERRAFYVAITRAEETVDILTQDGDESQFINELGDNIERVDRSEAVEPLDDVGTKMTVTARIKQLFDDVHKKKHQDGIIVDRYGGSARIVSWASNNPPTIQQGTWYQFENVRVDEYKNKKELVVTADSAITELRGPRSSSTSPAKRE